MILLLSGDRHPPKEEDAELTPEQIVALRERSVALIKTKYGSMQGSGTGFLVRPGILATNYHVIGSAHSDHLSVFFPSAGESGKKAMGVDKVLFFDRTLDLALISLKAPIPSHPALPLSANYQFKRAQNIVVIGNPGLGGEVQNLENAVSRGITSTELAIDGANTYQLDITVNAGNSGGPVLDDRGKVIGVVKSKATKQERISFCIPVQELDNAIVKAEKLGQLDRDKVTSTFNARVILCRINWSAEITDVGTIQIETAWQDAINRKLPVNPAILGAQAKFRKTLNPIPNALWDQQDVADYIARIGTDPMLSEATRQDFASLWQAHEAVRSNFQFVNGLLDNYRQSNDQNIKKCRDLATKLRITLGVTEQELRIPAS